MPTDTSVNYVLSQQAVRWAIDTLGAQKLHPTFVMYLYLRKQHRQNQLAQASASSPELLSLIELPGNPNKPYFFPLISRGERSGTPLSTFWRASNIPGSWSPRSLFRQTAAEWMAVDGGGYAMPDDHNQLARAKLLYGDRVSAIALGAYFLRNHGFSIPDLPGPSDVLAGFRWVFDYPPESESEFSNLFSTHIEGEVDFEWFVSF